MSGLIERQHYTFGNDKFSLEDAYHDCKLVFDGITGDDSFQEADTGLILYYANEIIYALREALRGVELIHCKDCEWWTKQDKSIQGRCELMQMYPTGEWFCGNAQKKVTDEKRTVKR